MQLQQLKVCLVTPFPPKEDGVAEYSKKIVESLQEKSVDLTVIAQVNKTKNPILSFKNNVKVFNIWNPHSFFNQVKVYRFISKIKPNVVHFQYGPCSSYGGLLGEPLLFLLLLLKLGRIKCITTLHSIWLANEAESRANERLSNKMLAKMASVYYYCFMYTFLRLCNLILVCVNFTDSDVSDQIIQFFKLSPNKIQQIVHGSTDQKIQLTSSNKSPKILFCPGFIRPEKGYEYAIDALKILKTKGIKVKLLIAGTPHTKESSTYLESLKQQANHLDLTQDIMFDTRYIPEDEFFNYYKTSDLLLLPYSRRIGPSGPLAIAASFGLPVLLTIDDKYILPSMTSFAKIVPAKKSPELADAIEGLFNDENAYQKMRASALAFSSRYSFDEIANQHIQFYKELGFKN